MDISANWLFLHKAQLFVFFLILAWSRTKLCSFSIPNSREQRRPKFESRLCIKTGPRISPCGRSTPRSVTGISANLRKEKSGNPWLQLQQENNPLLFTIFQFCFIRIFAASITEIRVVSHNLHSFKKSGTYCKLILNRHGGIWFGQELWLSNEWMNEWTAFSTTPPWSASKTMNEWMNEWMNKWMNE